MSSWLKNALNTARWCLAGLLLPGLAMAPASLWALSADSEIHVTVTRHVSVANISAMEFGEVSVNSVPGTVTLNPDGSRSSSGGVLIDSTGSASPARFMVEGMAGLDYQVQLPGQVVIGDGNGNTIIVDNLVAASRDTGAGSAPGVLELQVGGRLNLKENQAVGDYSGTLVVEVSYR